MVNIVANAAKAVMPGVNKFFGTMYNQYPMEYKEIFDVQGSSRNFEEDVNYSGIGLFRETPETGAVGYEDFNQTWGVIYRHIKYTLGFAISEEAVEDNLYEQLAYARAKALGQSAATTLEHLGADILNEGFVKVGADGVPLFSTAHRLGKGGTFSNRSASGTMLSEASLENAIQQIAKYTDDAGKIVAIRPMKLIVPVAQMHDAERILMNKLWRPGTADRDINAIATMGQLPSGFVVNHFLDDDLAFFIKTDAIDGAKCFMRRDVSIKNDTPDFDTDVMRFKSSFRVSFGVTDVRGLWANPGA